MTMFIGIRTFIRSSLAAAILLAGYVVVYGAAGTPVSDTFSNKDIITLLATLLQTVLFGIGIWLIANDREIFTRLRKVESAQQVRDKLCDERSAGSHGHDRATDKDPVLAAAVALDTIRKLIHSGELVIKPKDDIIV
jgi:uncharacterized membrane protein YcjF (UPF0283 family)